MASTTLTVRVDDDQKDRLEALAKSTGRSRSFLAADAIKEYLDANEWQVEGVKAAMRSLDERGGVAHDRVKAWATTLGSGRAASRPKPRKA